jgi:hypothetical protein
VADTWFVSERSHAALTVRALPLDRICGTAA